MEQSLQTAIFDISNSTSHYAVSRSQMRPLNYPVVRNDTLDWCRAIASFPTKLKLTPTDRVVLVTSHMEQNLQTEIFDISNSTSHYAVSRTLMRLLSYLVVLYDTAITSVFHWFGAIVSFPTKLKLTPTDRVVLVTSHMEQSLQTAIFDISNSTSHYTVSRSQMRLLNYPVVRNDTLDWCGAIASFPTKLKLTPTDRVVLVTSHMEQSLQTAIFDISNSTSHYSVSRSQMRPLNYPVVRNDTLDWCGTIASFPAKLKLTPTDRVVLVMSHMEQNLQTEIFDISNSTSHYAVSRTLMRLLSYLVVLYDTAVASVFHWFGAIVSFCAVLLVPQRIGLKKCKKTNRLRLGVVRLTKERRRTRKTCLAKKRILNKLQKQENRYKTLYANFVEYDEMAVQELSVLFVNEYRFKKEINEMKTALDTATAKLEEMKVEEKERELEQNSKKSLDAEFNPYKGQRIQDAAGGH